ncbi:MAG: regulator, partial [Bacteroidota bacterium]
PVLIANGEAPDIFVEGLVEQTIVRVLTPDGRLIAEFDAQGGRARWNARDLAGELVPSGVYLVIAEGLNGEGTAVGKIAVVR